MANNRESDSILRRRQRTTSSSSSRDPLTSPLCRVLLAYLCFAILVLTVQLGRGGRDATSNQHAAAATDVAECSRIGLETIQVRGGNAVDAAISAMSCMEVINLQSTGIGGGGFMVVYDETTKQSTAFDFRETAPSDFEWSHVERWHKEQVLSIGVPGSLRGFEAAHRQYGKLEWRELFQPAIALARDGFHVSDKLGSTIAGESDESLAKMSEELRNYIAPGGKRLHAGQLVKREKLAKTLQLVADSGSALAFYHGELARMLVQDVRQAGGILREVDMAAYTVNISLPLQADILGHTVMTARAPTSGPALLFALRVLERYHKQQIAESTVYERKKAHISHSPRDDPEIWHYVAETEKFAFAMRALLGDPNYNPTRIDELTRFMVENDASVDRAFQLIRPDRVLPDTGSYSLDIAPPHTQPFDKGTAGGAFVDEQNMFVAVINSINAPFGSRFMSKQLGILLNDELHDFSENAQDGPHNLPVAGKRPLSSMMPVIVFDRLGVKTRSRLRFALGGANSTRIFSGMLQVIARIVFLRESLSDSIESPRLHIADPTKAVEVEDTFALSVIEGLRKRGHRINPIAKGQSVITGVMKLYDRTFAHSDVRKGGIAAAV